MSTVWSSSGPTRSGGRSRRARAARDPRRRSAAAGCPPPRPRPGSPRRAPDPDLVTEDPQATRPSSDGAFGHDAALPAGYEIRTGACSITNRSRRARPSARSGRVPRRATAGRPALRERRGVPARAEGQPVEVDGDLGSPDRRHQHRLVCGPVLGLIEDDAAGGLEHLVCDLEAARQSGVLMTSRPTSILSSVGRRLPSSPSAPLTWYGVSSFSALVPRLLGLAHRYPNVGVHEVRFGQRLVGVFGDGHAARSCSARSRAISSTGSGATAPSARGARRNPVIAPSRAERPCCARRPCDVGDVVPRACGPTRPW